jgi:hypothetical protein
VHSVGKCEPDRGGLHAHIWRVPDYGHHHHSRGNLSSAGGRHNERENLRISVEGVADHLYTVDFVTLYGYLHSSPPIERGDGRDS